MKEPSKEERKKLLIEMMKEDEKNGMHEQVSETEDDKMIAKFMGLKSRIVGTYHPVEVWYKDDPDQWFSFPNYKTWNSLMPVVEKISLIIYESYTDNNGYKDVPVHERAYMRTFGMIDNQGKWMVRINRMPLEQEDTLIMAVYKAVVEFIKMV